MMKKRIIPIGGNSWGIILPKAILEALGINPMLHELSLEIEPDGIKLKKVKRSE